MGTLTAPIRGNDGAGGGLIGDGLLLDVILAEQAAADMLCEAVDIYDTGAIQLMGDVDGKMSDTLRARFIGLGWNLSMDATAAEDTDVTPSNVADDTSDVVVARRALGLSFTQFAQIIDNGFTVDPMRLATSMVNSFRLGRHKALITTVQGFAATTVDGSANNDIDDVFTVMDAAAALGIVADTPITMLMRYTGQWNRIRDSIRAEVGPLGLREDMKEVFGGKTLGATAQILRSVNIWTTDRITAAAGTYTGAWWVPGAVGYAIGSTRRVLSNALLRDPGVPMVVSWKEEAGSATNKLFGNAYDGSAIRAEYGGKFRGKE